jgi:hypothetical protein
LQGSLTPTASVAVAKCVAHELLELLVEHRLLVVEHSLVGVPCKITCPKSDRASEGVDPVVLC